MERKRIFLVGLLAAAGACAGLASAGGVDVLVNHLGYDSRGAKRAVIQARAPDEPTALPREFVLRDDSDREAWRGPLRRAGAVEGWRDRWFWTADFSAFRTPGRYRLAAGPFVSEPFQIQAGLLGDACLSDILFGLKSQRCSGDFDRFDHHVPFFGGRPGTLDVHGGWFDASGDFSKYLTHLSYATYMNPQQQPQVVWNLFAARDLLAGCRRERLQSLVQRIEDEARHGADFLVRMQHPEGWFCTTVHDVWTHVPENRTICSFRLQTGVRDDKYRAGWRMGAGSAIAALARAAALGKGGDFTPAEYLRAAVAGFRHLEKHNQDYLNDGRENIIDDYCALLAASELVRATHETGFLDAARRRAVSLAGRLASDERCRNWWRADDDRRPFWHAVEAGLPAIALLRYLEVEPDEARKPAVRLAVAASLQFEREVAAEVVNPFGLARQYVQDARGARRTSFFMPHDNDSGYWWQGENARLGSLAAAALLAQGAVEAPARLPLAAYAVDQLNWVLGLNPFDVCMLQGRGRNNPDYLPGYPNSPGGICNGITARPDEERDIAFLPEPWGRDPSHNWRWSEQWLPHDAWVFLALAALEATLPAQ